MSFSPEIMVEFTSYPVWPGPWWTLSVSFYWAVAVIVKAKTARNVCFIFVLYYATPLHYCRGSETLRVWEGYRKREAFPNVFSDLKFAAAVAVALLLNA
jgi:hypothetical protein